VRASPAEQVARQQVKQPAHEEDDRQDGQRKDDARAYLVVKCRRGHRRMRRRRHQPRRIGDHPVSITKQNQHGSLSLGMQKLEGVGEGRLHRKTSRDPGDEWRPAAGEPRVAGSGQDSGTSGDRRRVSLGWSAVDETQGRAEAGGE
jgi:hypothetical protein